MSDKFQNDADLFSKVPTQMQLDPLRATSNLFQQVET